MPAPTIYNPDKATWALLGLMRFLLALIVLLVHLQPFADMPVMMQQILQLGGKAAVVGFLLISGFSIGYSYRHSPTGYFKRRFLRIYPLYFFAVLLTVLLQYFLGSPYEVKNWTMSAAGLYTSLGNFLFLQGFVCITVTYNIPLWSLSIEVFFYLITPILYLAPKKVLYLGILVSMATFALYNFNFLYGYTALKFAWPWLIGFLISARQEKFWSTVFLCIGVYIVATSRFVTIENLSWVIITGVGLLIILNRYIKILLPEMVLKIFNYLGEISYPLYIFHVPIFLILSYTGVQSPYVFCLGSMIIIVPVNYVFDHWLKKIFWQPLLSSVSSGFNVGRVALYKQFRNT